jgi:toxin YoeB
MPGTNIFIGKIPIKKPKRINILIGEIERMPDEGRGKPEPLKHSLSGRWSRKITDEHRIVYKVEKDSVIIAQL